MHPVHDGMENRLKDGHAPLLLKENRRGEKCRPGHYMMRFTVYNFIHSGYTISAG
jgi:hypothetical protein